MLGKLRGIRWRPQRLVHSGVPRPKPCVVTGSAECTNSFHFIGKVTREPCLQDLKDAKVAKSAIISSKGDNWFLLEFWDSQALMAMTYLKEGYLIHVHGELVSERRTVEGVEKYNAKINVREFHHVIPKGLSPLEEPLEKLQSRQERKLKVAQRWNEFFAAPQRWSDDRHAKCNPRRPDFKHKLTREGLWITDFHKPSWVAAEIAKLEDRGILKKCEQDSLTLVSEN